MSHPLVKECVEMTEKLSAELTFNSQYESQVRVRYIFSDDL